MKKSLLRAALAATAIFAATTASAALVQSFDFTAAVTLSPTQVAGTWYTDRYAPAGFATSGGQLVQTISAADSAANRPGAYSSTFYDTQGRKYDLNAGVTALSIDLLVPSSWAGSNQRMAGLWGVAYDGSNTLSSYPILEFASDGLTPRFQGWNDLAGWVNYGLPGGFAYDVMHTLEIALNGANWEYSLDGVTLGLVSALGSTRIENVILQGYNKFLPSANGATNGDQRSYAIHWDNLVASDGTVPEPASLALAGVALMGLGLTRRRKVNKQA